MGQGNGWWFVFYPLAGKAWVVSWEHDLSWIGLVGSCFPFQSTLYDLIQYHMDYKGMLQEISGQITLLGCHGANGMEQLLVQFSSEPRGEPQCI